MADASSLLGVPDNNPVSVSDFSIVGEKSIRFELNDGECGYEPKWSDCENDRERTELYYKRYPSKYERWYQFYIFLPKDYNSYGSRRGNHEVMMRGTFANIRIRNEMAPGTEGGYTKLYPEEKIMPIYDAVVELSLIHI